MESPYTWEIVHKPKKKRPILLSEKVQRAADSRKEFAAKAESIVSSLTRLLTRTPKSQRANFRFADLPDELQLYILSIILPPRTCFIMEGKIANRYQSYKRRNPHYLAVKCKHIPLALVCRKWQEMIHQLRPKCFTIKKDTLVIPQWLIEAPGVSISNLSKVKSLIIAYKRKPNAKTIDLITKLSSDALVAYIHAGLVEHSTADRTIPRPEARITPYGPFVEQDEEYRNFTEEHLYRLASETGLQYARIKPFRISSGKRAEREQGVWYELGKLFNDTSIMVAFARKERRLDRDFLLMKEIALKYSSRNRELPSWASDGLRRFHDRLVNFSYNYVAQYGRLEEVSEDST